MRLLLDTHVLLWLLDGNPMKSHTARALVADPSNGVWVSAASAWEMAIKIQVGKLTLPVSFDELFPERLLAMEMNLLAIEIPHFKEFLKLTLHHRDPFDRMLVAQARFEQMTVLTRDPVFQKYGVPVIW